MVENGNLSKKKLYIVLALTSLLMKYSYLFITLAFLAPIPSLYAVNLNDSCDIKTFSCYEQHVESICNAKDDPFKNKWGVGPDL